MAEMAGMSSEFSANAPLSFDFSDGMDDNLVHRMTIPQKITVPGDDEENRARSRAGDLMTSSMDIPARIEIGTFPSPNSEIPRDLRDQMGHVNSMSSMITPPRTLTVDDTKSAHYPQRMPVGQPSAVRGSGERADPRLANVVKLMDDERYFD